MILVLNLNASVDKRYTLSDLKKGEVQRVTAVDNTPGGKGLHVANVDTILGEDTLVTGWLGGKPGEFIAERVRDYGIRGDFVPVAGETRSCLAILTAAGEQTEILEPGPMVTADELAAFRAKYRELLPGADLVVGSGSIPQGVPKSIYADLIREAHDAGKRFLLDTSGEALRTAFEAKPDFIKPNQAEVADLTGRRAETEEDAQHAICALLDAGLPLACVSLGADGSLLGVAAETPDDPPQLYRVKVPHIDCKNPVGSGDSFVGGFNIKKGQSMGLENGRIAAVEDDPNDAAYRAVRRAAKRSTEMITVYYGDSVTEEKAQQLCDRISEKFDDAAVMAVSGGQPVYHYLISVE